MAEVPSTFLPDVAPKPVAPTPQPSGGRGLSVIDSSTGTQERIDATNEAVRAYASQLASGTFRNRYKFPTKVPAIYTDRSGKQQMLLVEGDQVPALVNRDSKGRYKFFPTPEEFEGLRKQGVADAQFLEDGKMSSIANAIVSGGEWVIDSSNQLSQGFVPSMGEIQSAGRAVGRGDFAAAAMILPQAKAYAGVADAFGALPESVQEAQDRLDAGSTEYKLQRARTKDQKPISTFIGEAAPMIGIGIATAGVANPLALRAATGVYRVGASALAAGVVKSAVLTAAESVTVGLAHRAAQATQADQQLGWEGYTVDVGWDTVIGGGLGVLLPGGGRALKALGKLGARGTAAAAMTFGAPAIVSALPTGSFGVAAGFGAIITRGKRSKLTRGINWIADKGKGQITGAVTDVKTIGSYVANIGEAGRFSVVAGAKGTARGAKDSFKFLKDKILRTPSSTRVNRRVADVMKQRQRAVLDIADVISVDSTASAGKIREMVRQASKTIDDPEVVARLGKIAQNADSIVATRTRLAQLGDLGRAIEPELQKIKFVLPTEMSFPGGQAKRFREAGKHLVKNFGDEAGEIMTLKQQKMFAEYKPSGNARSGYHKWLKMRNEVFDDIASRKGAYEAEQFLETIDDSLMDTLSRDGFADFGESLLEFQATTDSFRAGTRLLGKSLQQSPEDMIRLAKEGRGIVDVMAASDIIDDMVLQLRGTGTQLKKVKGVTKQGEEFGKARAFEQMKGFTRLPGKGKGQIKDPRLQGLLIEIKNNLTSNVYKGGTQVRDLGAEGFDALTDMVDVERILRGEGGIPTLSSTTPIKDARDLKRMVQKSVENFLDDVDQSLLDMLEPGGRKGFLSKHPGAAAGVIYFREIGDRNEKRDAFIARRELVNAASPIPARMDAMQEGVGEITMGDPQTAVGFSRVTSTAVDYLSLQMPKSADPNFTEFSDMEMDEWLERYGASVNPVSVLATAIDGSVSSSAIDTIRTLYPSAYAHMTLEAAEFAEVFKDDLPYETLLGLDAFTLGALGIRTPLGNLPVGQISPQTGPQVQAKGASGGGLRGTENPNTTASGRLAAL